MIDYLKNVKSMIADNHLKEAANDDLDFYTSAHDLLSMVDSLIADKSMRDECADNMYLMVNIYEGSKKLKGIIK